MKEFLKLVKIWQSYCQKHCATFFHGTQCINCSRNSVSRLRLKSCLKDVQYVSHSAGQHISDVVTIHWYCNQWTSETACTTHPLLPVSAVPQFQTVIADAGLPTLHNLPGPSLNCLLATLQTRWRRLFVVQVFLAVWDAVPSCCMITSFQFILVVHSQWMLLVIFTSHYLSQIVADVCQKLLDSVKTFERYKQTCALAPLFGPDCNVCESVHLWLYIHVLLLVCKVYYDDLSDGEDSDFKKACQLSLLGESYLLLLLLMMMMTTEWIT